MKAQLCGRRCLSVFVFAFASMIGVSQAEQPFGVVVCSYGPNQLEARINFGPDAYYLSAGQAAQSCIDSGGNPTRIEMFAVK